MQPEVLLAVIPMVGILITGAYYWLFGEGNSAAEVDERLERYC